MYASSSLGTETIRPRSEATRGVAFMCHTSGGSPPTTEAVILVSISTSRTVSTATTFLSACPWVAL